MEKRSVLRGVDPVCSADVRYGKIGRKKKKACGSVSTKGNKNEA